MCKLEMPSKNNNIKDALNLPPANQNDQVQAALELLLQELAALKKTLSVIENKLRIQRELPDMQMNGKSSKKSG